jgi:excisionase family DNA binding protein
MSDDLIDGNDRLMTSTEVASVFRVDRSTVSRWASEGRVESIRTPGGRQFRYRESEIRKLLSEGNPEDVDQQN